MYKIILISFLFICSSIISFSQENVSFKADDGLKISASLYEMGDDKPFILLFHQAGYSKGEFKETAPKLAKLGYNCLAVDLRSGDNVNYIQNETAQRAKNEDYPNSYIDAEQDIKAAIDWAYNKSGKKVIILGSSYSASLCLKIAKGNPKVHAVLAFSPGEYFKPDFNIKEELKLFDKPVFAASSKKEYKYLEELMEFVPEAKKTLFKPKDNEGFHGSKALWSEKKGK